MIISRRKSCLHESELIKNGSKYLPKILIYTAVLFTAEATLTKESRFLCISYCQGLGRRFTPDTPVSSINNILAVIM